MLYHQPVSNLLRFMCICDYINFYIIYEYTSIVILDTE